MAKVTRTTTLPGPISAAEDLWYDLGRRASFVEGFGHVAKVEGDWPRAGSRVLWDAAPSSSRGRIVENVDAHEARLGQTVYYEDAELRGTQTLAFAPGGDGQVVVTVTQDWTLKERAPLKDATVVRRRVGEALRRTLARYRIERLSDLDDERTASPGGP